MDCAPNINIFRELQVVHDFGYFDSHISPEDRWQQVYTFNYCLQWHNNLKLSSTIGKHVHKVHYDHYRNKFAHFLHHKEIENV